MSAVLQTILVALLVTAAALFAAWRLAPSRSRWRLLQWLSNATAAGGARPPGFLRRRLLHLTDTAAKQMANACGQCSHAADVRDKSPSDRTDRTSP